MLAGKRLGYSMKNIQQDLSAYRTLVFDCDGVLLDSNKVKTQAFFQAALPYGETAAQLLADYHVANGGVSRYKKFAYFLEKIVNQNNDTDALDHLLRSYADHVKSGLLSCKICAGLEELREQTKHARWLIISGGDQIELREVFEARNLASLFDGGIFGSPDTKEEILSREIGAERIQLPAIFFGDSKYDYKAATGENIDFLFLSDWTEVHDWQFWCRENHIYSQPNISSLLEIPVESPSNL
ncbi:HAD family hydrolase [Pseudomonas sp. p99-361]|uniref:HAD family hydrolase n=1 Tax=Pseudomonas sp. p99-361 TaxID=2479852 RepID=UPI0021155105|nr:HAD family hydrolase [Pseudomonas sp. p99-361]